MLTTGGRRLWLKVLFINDSTSSSNWGDRAAAFSLKAMVAEAGASISGIVTEEELARTSFGEPGERRSAEDGRRAILRSILPPVILSARRRILNVVELTAANRVIPERWDGFSRAADFGHRGVRRTVAVASRGDPAGGPRGHPRRWRHGRRGDHPTNRPLPRLPCARASGHARRPRQSQRRFRPARAAANGRARLSAVCRCCLSRPGLGHPVGAPWRWTLRSRQRVLVHACRARDAWVPLAGRPTYFDVWPDTAPFDPAAPYLCVGGSSLHSTAWRPLELARPTRPWSPACVPSTGARSC